MSRLSVIIPTLNEAGNIQEVLATVRSGLRADAECIVVDGGSVDGTAEHALELGATVLRAAGGRGAQLAAGVAAARGDILLFLHADTRLPPGAQAALDAALADPAVSGGAFRVRFLEPDLPFSLRALAAGINFRSRLFTTATGDQAIFARADVLARVGGVPQVPLFEDVRLFRALRRGGRVVLLDIAVSTSARLWKRRGTVPVIALHLVFRTLHAAGVSPHTLARWYATASR